MRIKEILKESPKQGKMLKAQSKVSPGAVFAPVPYDYSFYRAGVLMGCSPENLNDVDAYNWGTAFPMIITYTDEEREMTRQTFKKLGIPFQELMSHCSEEPDPINTASPIKAFKGYPK